MLKFLLFKLVNIIVEMRYPEITKKMSTPMNPPGNIFGNA
jgi:hypothetical protein